MPRKVTTTGQAPNNQSGVTVQVELGAPVRARRAIAGDHQRLTAPPSQAPGRIPRIARLMALAIKFQDMIDRGEVRDFAEIATLGYVTRARVTQIMNLLNLAPDIQSEILGLSESTGANCGGAERDLRSVTRLVLWSDQRSARGAMRKP